MRKEKQGMEKTFDAGDVVVYKASGVFLIARIWIPDFLWEEHLRYFTLKGVHAKNPKEGAPCPDQLSWAHAACHRKRTDGGVSERF